MVFQNKNYGKLKNIYEIFKLTLMLTICFMISGWFLFGLLLDFIFGFLFPMYSIRNVWTASI